MSAAFHGAEFCWMNGEIVETRKALVSAMEPIHLGIFEGIKAYVENDVTGKGRLNIFRWESHVERLMRSAAVCGLKIPYSDEELLEATKKTIRANGFDTNVYIQPRIWPSGNCRRGSRCHSSLGIRNRSWRRQSEVFKESQVHD